MYTLLTGFCVPADVAEKKQLSKKIDKEIFDSIARNRQKMLLLGPGESGKSTLVKQMQIIHLNGFSQDELENRKYFVYSNILRSMQDLYYALDLLKISLGNNKNELAIDLIERTLKNGHEYEPLTLEITDALQNLWSDFGIQKCYERRSEFQLNDSTKYFFDNLCRITEPGYLPSYQDILHTRVTTTSIVRITFELKGIDFHVFDVGGQRTQRKKWIHIFDDVNAILFVAAISEYDQKIREDNQTNRMAEALNLFDEISNSLYFEKSSIIMFMNKKDLFEEKIKRVPLTVCFPNYDGRQTYDDGIKFMEMQFRKIFKPIDKMLYIHETCATDTNQVQLIFQSVLDTIIKKNRKDIGLA